MARRGEPVEPKLIRYFPLGANRREGLSPLTVGDVVRVQVRVDADGNTGYGDEDIGTAGDETPGLTDAEVEQSATAGNMYEVVKVGVDAPSATTATTEDRFYFVVDKAINWDGSATLARKDFGIGGGPTGWTLGPISQGQFDGMAAPGDQAIGTVPVVKFSPGATSLPSSPMMRKRAVSPILPTEPLCAIHSTPEITQAPCRSVPP